jgi:hypothetical protein
MWPSRPPSQWISQPISAEVRRLGRETDQWHLSSVEVKIGWKYTVTMPNVLWAAEEGNLIYWYF